MPMGDENDNENENDIDNIKGMRRSLQSSITFHYRNIANKILIHPK